MKQRQEGKASNKSRPASHTLHLGIYKDHLAMQILKHTLQTHTCRTFLEVKYQKKQDKLELLKKISG